MNKYTADEHRMTLEALQTRAANLTEGERETLQTAAIEAAANETPTRPASVRAIIGTRFSDVTPVWNR